jgi:xylulokinase
MTIAGNLHGYFTRYGLSVGIPVSVWTGDNPGSLVGTGCFASGISGISLGTSDTLFAPMETFHTDPEHYGHIFGNPAGGFMSLICFSNGSLAREKILQMHDMDWQKCEDLMSKTPCNNGDRLMLPYFEAESTPLVLKPQVVRNYRDYDASQDIRAILESQMLSMRLHSLWLDGNIQKLRLTGGGSKSQAICQIAADVFNAEIERIRVSNSAGLGGAMMAAASVSGVPLTELAEMFCKGETAAVPDEEHVKYYREKLEKYRQFEKSFRDSLL